MAGSVCCRLPGTFGDHHLRNFYVGNKPMTYRLDWIVTKEHVRAALDKVDQGSETFDTEQEARQRKEFLRATKPGVVITGPYRTAYAGRFTR